MTSMRARIVMLLALGLTGGAHARAPNGTYIQIPVSIPDATGTAIEAQQGLFFVLENRRDPRSRTIAIHFLRFPARAGSQTQAGRKRPAVFLLPGGPGTEFDFKDTKLLRAVERLRRTRDVVYVSQRGNPRAPGLVANLTVTEPQAPLDGSLSAARTQGAKQAAMRRAIEEWTARGVDLRGYDILNIVDDLYELRAALGYERIVLRGCSFGSQWSLAYIKRWPDTVDRALLSGVEPLDYTYDSPKWLWASMSRLAKQAEADAKLARHIPDGDLMKALRTVTERLERAPVTVTITDPKTGRDVRIVLGADDLREQIADARGFLGDTTRESLANWPRFILELHGGGLRYLAARAWELRTAGGATPLIGALIDNSLGISPARDSMLLAEREARWLGDINQDYRNTREITPTPDVGVGFRSDWPIDVPVLLVHGDFDWSTPLENAQHLRAHLKQGHLLEVEGATHCTEVPEMAELLPEVTEQIYSFIDADFEKNTAQRFFATLPHAVAYPALAFSAPTGPSLYDQWLIRRRAAQGE